MELAIIKYNAGNIQSVLYALERIGATASVTDNPEEIRSADKVIFPGVGEASSAMRYLRDRKLDELIRGLQQPVLGICLGMQLLCSYSEENDTTCIGVFEEPVRKFRPPAQAVSVKVPQIGWNDVYDLKSPLFHSIPEHSYYYFVHGYYASLGPHTIATADYVQPYSAALKHRNFYGAQFHPEKSANAGEQLLKNFLAI